MKCVVLFKRTWLFLKGSCEGKSAVEESERSERGRKRRDHLFSSGRSFWETAVRETVRGKLWAIKRGET